MSGGESPIIDIQLPEGADSRISSARDQAESSIQKIKQKALENLKNPNLLKLAEQEFYELENAVKTHELDQDKVHEAKIEFENDVKALERLENKFSSYEIPGGNTQEGLENMIDFLSILPPDSQEAIMEVLNSSPRKLKKYFKENGFINADTYARLQQSKLGEGLIDIAVQDKAKEEEINKESNNDKVDQINKEVQKTQKIFNLMLKEGSIDSVLIEKYQNLLDIGPTTTKNKNEVKEKFDAIISYFKELSQDPERFAKTLDSLGGPDSELYEATKSLVLTSSPGLQASFKKYEGEYVPTLTKTQKEVSEQVIRDMNKDIIGDDNIAEEYDYSKNPPSRSIKLEGSEYAMESNLPVGDFYPATVEYTNVTQEVESKLNSIEAVMTYIDKLTGSEDLQEVKDILITMIPYTVKQSLGMDINSYKSVGEIKVSFHGVLGQKKRELEEKRNEAREKYEESINELRDAYKKTLREQQEQQRDILNFLKRTGFDLIPQGFTDRIIAEINFRKNIDLGNDLRINSDIDISNSEFGVNLAGENSIREQEGFIRLINKMVTGESEGEKALIREPGSFISQKMIVDPREMRERLNTEDGIIGAGGGLDMNQVYKNLWNKEATDFDLSQSS